jgi:signal transduction histidine kinase
VGLVVALVLGFFFLAGGFAWRWFGGGGGFGPGEGGRGWSGPPFFLIILGLLGVAFLAGRAVRRVAAPIGDVMEAADRVAGGDYSTRVKVRGPGEVGRLASSFNQMTERLQASETQRRALLADVAHELRTPLSVIRGNVEGMLDGVYPPDEAHLGPVLEETAVMARLLDDLQTLSTAEAGVLRLYRERVDPLGLAQDTAAALRPRAERAGVSLDVRVTAPVPEVDVDQVRIGEVLANLLTNAIRHTPRGGAVRVEVSPAPGGVAFAVSDTGPGIDARDLPHVFDRFVKSADSGGAGLGLAIARGLVEAHGGRITAESTPGAGTTMRFVLPAVGNFAGSSG